MESSFGADFSMVRVHVGPEAAAVGAVAFTRDAHIFFAPGHYTPQTLHGQQLIAHELTHVIQQRSGRVRNPFGAGVAVVHDQALEAEATRLGYRAAMSTPPVAVTVAHGVRAAERPGVVMRRAATGVVQRASGGTTPASIAGPQSNTSTALVTTGSAAARPAPSRGPEAWNTAVRAGLHLALAYDPSTLGSAHGVNRATRDFIDARLPTMWMILHRMKGGGGSFSRYLGALGVRAASGPALKAPFEKTLSKYDPKAFGESHTWSGNLRWLEAATAKFPRTVLTELPLKRANILRQSAHIHPSQPEFSAYAREIAWLLLRGWDVRVATRAGGMPVVFMERPASPDPARMKMVAKYDMVLAAVLRGSASKVDFIDVLDAFFALGIPIEESALADVEAVRKSREGKVDPVLEACRTYYNSNKKPGAADAQQWPADYLESMLKVALKRSLVSKAEVKMWRPKIAAWVKEGLFK